MERTGDNDIFRYDYNKADYVKMSDLLDKVDWNIVTTSQDVNEACNNFQSHLSRAFKECVPLVKITNGKQVNLLQFNGSAKKIVRKKYFAWKRYTL